MTVTGPTLTLTDDDDAPNATLALSAASIAEMGGMSTVSATLSHPSSQPTTVTVTGVTGFYTAGTDASIAIAAGGHGQRHGRGNDYRGGQRDGRSRTGRGR